MELYKKYRPKDFDDVIGQDHIVASLSRMVDQKRIPHAMLFCGPPGCGKTTFGRILKRKLKCSDWDFVEQNCSNKTGIDSIREIEQKMSMRPMKGKVRIWLFDECHTWSSSAQDALLKTLEDTPKHVYFILCTTDPQKLKKTIRSRCTEFPVKPLDAKALEKIIRNVCESEKTKISDEVIEKIVQNADGSARNALVLLNKTHTLKTEEEQLDAVNKASVETAAITIARTLFNFNTNWGEMSKVLRETELEDPESIRWMILGYARSILTKATSPNKMTDKAFQIIQVFRDNWYDSKSAGLVASCYEIIVGA